MVKSGYHRIRLVPLDTMYEPIDEPFFARPLSKNKLMIPLTKKVVSVFVGESEEGDELSIDDRHIAVPNHSPLEYSHGIHGAIARNVRTNRVLHQGVSFPPGSDYTLKVRLGYPSIRPIIASIVVPGVGQFQDNAVLEAGVCFATTIGAALYCHSSTVAFTQAHEDYDAAVTAYRNATTESDAVSLRNKSNQLFTKLGESKRQQNISVGILVGV